MGEKQETIADIIAEMRREYYVGAEYDGAEVQNLVDRLEAAQKCEVGNGAKMREALAPFPSLCEWLIENAAKIGISDMVPKLRERCDQARAALTEPRRNCDVGTAEEQAERFDDFCRNTCDGCRCDHRLFQEEDKIKCAFAWAQMPYESKEGGEK